MEAKTFALVACNPVGLRYGLDRVRLGLMSVVWRTEEVYRIQKVLPIEIVGKEGESFEPGPLKFVAADPKR